MNDGQLNKTTRHKMDVTEMKMLRGNFRENERLSFKVVWTCSKKRIRCDSKNSGVDGKGDVYKK